MTNSIFKMLDFSKIVSGAKNASSFVTKAIPIYKQVTPVVQNVRSAFSSVSSIRKAAKDNVIKEIKEFDRPTTIFRKKSLNDERGHINLDTLRFFK